MRPVSIDRRTNAEVSPQEALARRVQEILAARHGIRSELHANHGAAMLLISTQLVPWFYPRVVQWQSGESPARPGCPAMTMVSVDEGTDEIARRIAERFRQIRHSPPY